MTTAADHYERLLAEHYTWMLGDDIDASAAVQADLLRGLGLTGPPGDRAMAVDLGCGPGPQTLALAGLGYGSVSAVDTSAGLLEELRRHAGRRGVDRIVDTVHADLRGALPRLVAPGSVAAVVCMGDTLPHLPHRDDVRQLIADAAESLRPGGSLVLSYRDLTVERRDTDRFIPVRQTADRILTCFLDYIDDDTVMVYDILHTRRDGAWELRTGGYPKLRLPQDWLADRCRAAGLAVRHAETSPHGLHILHAVKG